MKSAIKDYFKKDLERRVIVVEISFSYRELLSLSNSQIHQCLDSLLQEIGNGDSRNNQNQEQLAKGMKLNDVSIVQEVN